MCEKETSLLEIFLFRFGFFPMTRNSQVRMTISSCDLMIYGNFFQFHACMILLLTFNGLLTVQMRDSNTR